MIYQDDDYGPEDYEAVDPPEPDLSQTHDKYEYDQYDDQDRQDEIDAHVDFLWAEEQGSLDRERDTEYRRIIESDRKDRTIAKVIYFFCALWLLGVFLKNFV